MLPEAELRWRLEPEDPPGGPPPARTKGPATPRAVAYGRRRSGSAEHVGNVGRRSRPVSAPHCAPRGGAWDQIHVPVGQKSAGRVPVGGSALCGLERLSPVHTPGPGLVWALLPAPLQRCGAARTHLHKEEDEDQNATPAVQAVQVGVAFLPVEVEHRHQA